MHSITKNIKLIRKEKGWTQQQMADYLFVTRQTVSNWENGRALPDLETIEQISEKLGIDSQYLLYGKLTEEKYRKFNALTATIVMTAAVLFCIFCEKVNYVILRRISQYAGYEILECSAGYNDFHTSIILMLMCTVWMIILLVNWVIADSSSIFARLLKIATNTSLAIILMLSIYSAVGDSLYTYRRYKNVVITARERFEMSENVYAVSTFLYYDFGWRGGTTEQLVYIDNDDAETDRFMEYLISSQALKVYRVESESSTAEFLMWKHNVKNTPAVLIVHDCNVEALEGYEEISAQLETKIHNYKMVNIFFY